MSETLYYVEDFSDEVIPCAATLEAWAEWLSKPDSEWGRDEPATDGESFRVNVMRLEDDIIATRTADGWSFSREVPPDAHIIAVRYGPGLGWSPDAMVETEADLRELLAVDGDEEERIAIGFFEPDVVAIYRADPPRLIVEGAVQ